MLQARSYVLSAAGWWWPWTWSYFLSREHDILMDRLGRRIAHPAVLRLVRAYLDAGVMADGVVIERLKGPPQGGPLSLLLVNVLLNEVDRELERRGHCFVRYADDCNVYVRSSRRVGERGMAMLRRLYGRLKLPFNEAKSGGRMRWPRSASSSVFAFYAHQGRTRCGVATKPLQAFK